MKKFKSVIAMVLALVLSLGVVSTAFAANGNSITWTADGETVTCTYHSDLEVGVNTIKIEESGYYYFDLSDLENGYYSAKLSDDVFEYFCTPEKSGGKYEGWGNMELIDGTEQIIFHRNENVDIAVAGFYGASDSMTIEIEYFGEDIESVEIENPYELIVGYDIENYGSDEWAVKLDTKVTFTGGKTIEANSVRYCFDFDGEPEKGENKVNLAFAGYEWEQTLNVAYIEDYVSGVDVIIPEDLVVCVYYYYGYEIKNEIGEITVNFTDGTSQKVNPDQKPGYITLPNGREIEINCNYNVYFSTLTANFRVSARGNILGETELKTEKASFKENVEYLKIGIDPDFERLAYHVERITAALVNGDFKMAELYTRYMITFIRINVNGIFNQIGLFINFMFI